MRKLNIGLSDEQRQGVCDVLNRNLANQYLLLIKTKKYHWDVMGPNFRSLHKILQDQYESLKETIDSTAERVRILGEFPLGTAAEFVQFSTIKEHTGEVPSASDMVSNLLNDHEQMICTLRESVDRCADDFHDAGTADFLTEIMEQHEEMAWMLRSFIEGYKIEPDNQLPDEIRFPAGVAK